MLRYVARENIHEKPLKMESWMINTTARVKKAIDEVKVDVIRVKSRVDKTCRIDPLSFSKQMAQFYCITTGNMSAGTAEGALRSARRAPARLCDKQELA